MVSLTGSSLLSVHRPAYTDRGPLCRYKGGPTAPLEWRGQLSTTSVALSDAQQVAVLSAVVRPKSGQRCPHTGNGLIDADCQQQGVAIGGARLSVVK